MFSWIYLDIHLLIVSRWKLTPVWRSLTVKL
jgi:hypothetical protein